MSITLELSPEVEARLRADATAQRVPVETLALQAVEAFVTRPSSEQRDERRAARSRLKGRYPSARTVADFMADRSAEEGDK